MRSLTDLLYIERDLPPTEQLAHRRSLREEGRDWPTSAHTMVGLRRLENIERCIGEVLRDRVPGDLLEAGVWRGGACIFMRGVLKAYGVKDRSVWVADSFAGLPAPDVERYPQDAASELYAIPYLAVPQEQVEENFRRYGLLDSQVRFLPGWFPQSLSHAPVQQLAVLRLDADMYASTTAALHALYDKLSPGGFLIVDDYGCIPACRQAVDDFRRLRNITEDVVPIDWTGVYWRKRKRTNERGSMQPCSGSGHGDTWRA